MKEVPESWLNYHEGDLVNVFNRAEHEWYTRGVVVCTEMDVPKDVMVHFPNHELFGKPENIIVPECNLVLVH